MRRNLLRFSRASAFTGSLCSLSSSIASRGTPPSRPQLSKALAAGTQKVQIRFMKRSVDLDEDLASEVDRTSSLIHEKPATVIRLAIRAGLPVVANRFQSPLPDGYFADDYPLSNDRLKLEAAMSKAGIGPDR